MLILVRRCEQSILIETSDGPITVKVLDVERFYHQSQLATARVKLGVDAPKTCKVLRSELPQ